MSSNHRTESFAPSVLGLALLQAGLLWLLHGSVTNATWPATSPAILLPSYLIVLAAPLTLLMLWKYRGHRLLWAAVGAMSAFLAWAGYQAFGEVVGLVGENNPHEDHIAGFVLPLVLAWLIGLPLLRARLETGRWLAPYVELFNGSWRSYLLLAQSVLFTGVFWGLLGLCAALFAMLGNDFFKALFADPRFVYPATAVVFAGATQLVGSRDRFVEAVLDQLLGLLKWLAPLAGLIVILFAIALLPRLPELFSSGERVINSSILLMLVAVTLLLINAAYRDGTVDPGYGKWITQALRIVPPLLVVVAATALLSIVVRMNELGLTPARYWGAITASFALLYALGYSIASLRSGTWFASLNRVNPLLAVVLFGSLLISVTPLVDPLRLSVASQLSRALQADSPATRDGALRYLRFDAGNLGRDTLAAIAAGEYSADPTLRAAASLVSTLDSKRTPTSADPAATPERYAAWRQTLRVLPQGRTLPADLEAALEKQFELWASEMDPQAGAPPPQLLFLDIDADGIEEAMLMSGTLRGEPSTIRDYRLFSFRDQRWALELGGVLRNK